MERDMKPLCAKCGRKVDEIRWWADPRGNGWVYEARCHGETERTVIHKALLVNCRGPLSIEPGVAFPARDWLVEGGTPILSLDHAAAAPPDG